MYVSWSYINLRKFIQIRQFLHVLSTMFFYCQIIVENVAWRSCSVLQDERFGQHDNQYAVFFAILKRTMLLLLHFTYPFY